MPKGKRATGKTSAAQESAQGSGIDMATMMPAERDLVKMKVRAKFTKFFPRFQVNADKLELIFEVAWGSIPEGFLDQVQSAVRQFGDLSWTESKVQKEPRPEDPTQRKLEGIG